ncbi:hypothetical protein J2795_000582 [Chryseobacterium bernardetii]|uniref:Uncharacterized protein n=1 Tax=Chryseobacterium bernardetii TaxID=1241978 RepID=A0ACC6IQM2_9FLAO|nr:MULTISPECIES: hypothetical protein [Chryseobacterium]MDR6369181.1 hypothetical protein [Chryseobacterium vietnamense]MDR6439897.1 hypothetical protein [Chryseobacterium bernardetii]
MKRNLLLAGLLTTFSLVAKSQVGINTTNPQGVFNIDGLKNNPTTGVPTAVQAADDLVMTSNGNLGLGLTAPGTTLDVKGAITNRETALAVAGNAVTIPANVSLVRLTGAATANVAISAFAAPNPGQRLIVYNNTTGGFGATLDGTTVPNGKALEFIFSNSFWRSTDGGSAGATPVNLYTADGTLAGNRVVTTAGNSLSFTNGSNNVYVGTTGTEGTVKATGSSRGSFIATGGAAALNMYVDNNAKAQITTTGTNTGMDIGSATADPVSIITNNTQRVIVTSTGNVGVNVVTPDPSAILDLNGINRGLLLPRVFLGSITDATNVPTPATGLMVYNYNTALTPYGQGIYYNSGTSAAPNWDKLSPQKSDFILSAVVFSAATSPVDQAATGTAPTPVVVDNVNIGLTTTVTVPPNSTAKILMTYNVPMGTYPAGATSGNTNVNGYFGIRFLKDGVEAQEGSRKYAIPYASAGSHMMSVTGNFTETIVNNGSSPLNIVYTLNGYVESTETAVRFNMWASSGDNFNWGKGSLTGTVFVKPN